MAGEFDYNVVIRGIEAAIAGLGKLNKALGIGEGKAEKHAGAMDALGDQIAEVARLFGTQEAKAKTLFNAIAEGANSVEEAMLSVVAVERTYYNSLNQTGDKEKAATTAIKKGNKILKDRTTARQEQVRVEEQYQAAIEETADVEAKKKKPAFTGKPQDITQALTKVSNQDSLEISSAAAQAQINEINKANEAISAEENARRQIREHNLELDKKLDQEALDNATAYYDSLEKASQKAKSFEEEELSRTRGANEKAFDSEALSRANSYYDSLIENLDKVAKEEEAARQKKVKSEEKVADELTANAWKRSEDELKAEEAVFQKKLKDARAYLQFQQDLEDGLTKKQVSNISGEKAGSIDRGASVVLEAEADAHSRLAKEIEIERVAIKKASDAKKEYIDRATAADAKVKEFTLSWQTMGRIIVAQAFNEAFFAIQNGIRSAVTEAEELYKAVAEVQTIVSQSARGVSNYFGAVEEVLRTSSEINFTPQDTANAFYETLSNQIGDSVTQIRAFIGEAGNLGKVTRSTLADSADAITAVINSYSLSVSDAAEISAELFTLVDQGRVKLEEVANHMGNVSVPASQLGVDFKNVVAALSAISIAGIPAREAMTLQRNVMFKLIDPTEKMTELFSKWGVSSAQAAIAAFGFQGVIQRLAVEAEKGNEEIAALMGTIRGTRGILGLTGENFEKYMGALEAANKATETYSKTVNEYLSNPGERFAKLQQEISNEFLRMGLRIVNLVASIDSFFRSVETGESPIATLIGGLSKFALVGGAAAATFLIIASAIGALSAAALAVPAAMAGAVYAVAGLAAVVVGGTVGFAAFGKTAEETFANIQADASKMNKDVSKSFEQGIIGALDQTAEDSFKKSQAALANIANTIADINIAAKQQDAKVALDDLASGLDRLIRAFGGSDVDQKLIHIFSSAQDVADLYGDSANWTTDGIDKVIDAHDREAKAIQRKIDKLDDQRNKILDVAGANRIALAQDITNRNINALAPNQRGAAQFQAAQGAANAAANAADPEESKRLFEVARNFLQEAERTAFETGAFGTIENHTQFFNQQQSELVAMQERRLQAEDQYIKKQQESLEQQKQYHQQQQQIGQTEVDRRHELEEQFKLEKAFLDEYKRIKDQIIKDDQLSPEQRVAKIGELNNQTQAGLDKIGASDFTRQQFASELDKNSSQIAADTLGQVEENLTKERQRAIEVTKNAKQAAEEYGDTLEDISAKIGTAVGLLNEKTKTEVFPSDPSQMPQYISDPRVEKLQADYNALIAASKNQANPLPIEQFEAGLADIYNRANQLSIETGDPMIAAQIQAAYDQIELSNMQRAAAEGLTFQANNAAAGLDALTQAVNRTINMLNTPQGMPGPVYYAKGGPVGTDTVPAWLSPGEFVVNARAARSNFSWLQAINTHGNAARFANGGPVNQSQSFVNNFNVTSSNPNAQVGAIVGAIRRQISQGKATLSKRRPY